MALRLRLRKRDYAFDKGAEFDNLRARFKASLDAAIKDENEAVAMYMAMTDMARELGNGILALDISQIRQQESEHYQTLKAIRRLLYGNYKYRTWNE